MGLNCKHIVWLAICCIRTSVITGIATTCEGPTLVEKGSPANITCNFDSHIIEKRKPFGIDKYTGGLPHVMVRCQWPDATSVDPTCTPKAGYLDLVVLSPSEPLTMHIPSVTEKYAGTYGCCEMASNNPIESCNLTVKASVNDSGGRTNFVIIIVPLVVGLGLVGIIIKRKNGHQQRSGEIHSEPVQDQHSSGHKYENTAYEEPLYQNTMEK